MACARRRRDYSSFTTPEPTAAPETAGEILLALDGDPALPAGPGVLEAELRRAFPRHAAAVLVVRAHAGEVVLVSADEAAAVPPGPTDAPLPSLARGGLRGRESPLRAALAQAVQRNAAAVALVSGAPRHGATDWLATLVGPVLDGIADYVRPTYARAVTDGTLNTGIVYPLTRALYGRRLRQPLGGEACLSAGLARRLLDDADWRRDPEHAGSDAWLVAKALAGKHRCCQAWLGPMPASTGEPEEDARGALARVLGPVFREMERHVVRWQRVTGSETVPAVGPSDLPAGDGPPHASVDRLAEAFRHAQSDLAQIWSLVFPPGTLLALRRAARLPAEELRIEDATWARAVYDVAVAHHVKTMERTQLLGAFTPLYLGWLAGFLHEVHGLDPHAADARVERLCAAFEAEKPYLIGRWRWPDGFMP